MLPVVSFKDRAPVSARQQMKYAKNYVILDADFTRQCSLLACDIKLMISIVI